MMHYYYWAFDLLYVSKPTGTGDLSTLVALVVLVVFSA